MATDDKNQGSTKEIKAKGQSRDDERQPKRREMRVIEEGVKTLYSGTYNISLGPDEVTFVFGNRSLDPSVMRIESKIAVSLKTAKRMAITLGDLIRRYETSNGPIDLTSKKSVPIQSDKEEGYSDDNINKH